MSDFIFKERIDGVGERLFNNPLTRVSSDGIRYRTTRMRLPSWVDHNVMTEGVDDIASSSIDITIERISEARPINVLRNSTIFPDVSKEYRANNLVSEFEDKAPSDGVEMVGWMHQGSADQAVMDAWANEYGRNSSVTTASGDAQVPGFSAGSYKFNGMRGAQVASRGSARLDTPNNEVEVPNNEGTIVFNQDNIGVAGVNASGGYQWNGTVGKFQELAETPIGESVRFPKLQGYAVPNVFNQSPSADSEQQQVSFNVSANGEQDVSIAFRNPNNYNEVISENTLTVPEGTSQVQFEMAASPAVPPLVTEMNPNNSGDVQSVESYSVEAQ